MDLDHFILHIIIVLDLIHFTVDTLMEGFTGQGIIKVHQNKVSPIYDLMKRSLAIGFFLSYLQKYIWKHQSKIYSSSS